MWRIQRPVGHLPLLAAEAELLTEHCSVLLVLRGLSHDLRENLGLSSEVLRASRFCGTRQKVPLASGSWSGCMVSCKLYR